MGKEKSNYELLERVKQRRSAVYILDEKPSDKELNNVKESMYSTRVCNDFFFVMNSMDFTTSK